MLSEIFALIFSEQEQVYYWTDADREFVAELAG